jgi:hypothetical protein
MSRGFSGWEKQFSHRQKRPYWRHVVSGAVVWHEPSSTEAML